MIKLVKEIYNNWNVLWIQVWVYLKTDIINTKLGYIWYLLDPLILMVIYYFIVRIVFERGGPGYHTFILCGLVVWQWFAKSIIKGTSAFNRSKSLIKATQVPLVIYLLSPALIHMIITLIGFAIVITFSYQFNFLIYIYLLPLLTVQLLLIIALSCFLSVTNAYLPDIQKFVLYGIRLLFYLSPVLYDSSRVLNSDKVPIFAKTVFQCNPFASLLPAYRDVLIRGLVPDMEIILIWFGIAVILLQLGVMLVRNQRNYIPKLI